MNTVQIFDLYIKLIEEEYTTNQQRFYRLANNKDSTLNKAKLKFKKNEEAAKKPSSEFESMMKSQNQFHDSQIMSSVLRDDPSFLFQPGRVSNNSGFGAQLAPQPN